MKRRSYLVAAAPLITPGCRGLRSSSDEPTAVPDSPVETVEIGSEDDGSSEIRPHYVVVRNAAATSQDVVVRIRSEADDEGSLLNERYDVPADASVRVRLHAPDDYVVMVTRPTPDAELRISISKEEFDCNHAEHEVTVPESAEITSNTSTELKDCPE